MHIVVFGLNYRTAPVEIREKFTFTEEELPEAVKQLSRTKSILECVIVATCNRTEMYVVVDRLTVCGNDIRGFLEDWFGIPRGEFAKELYVYKDQDAIRHLYRVACGLDSMIIGETQILGQVRSAFLLAQKEKATGVLFNRLFKQAITLAKKAHTETSINDNPVSVSYAAVELARSIFGSFAHKNVLIIGAGKMSELTLKHLHTGGANQIIVANRTLSKAEQLAEDFSGLAVTLERLTSHLHEADIVISSTGAPGTVLTKAQVAEAMARRKSRPMFFVDIAVPRDLDPGIGDLDNVFLYDIDDLEGIVTSNMEQRNKEAAIVERMIAADMDAFETWYKTLGVSPVIRALQEKAAAIHEETMESMQRKLPDLTERELKVIRKLTKSIVNQVLHDPILRIKELAGEKGGEEALRMFAHFFALDEKLREEQEAEESADAEHKDENREVAGSDGSLPLFLSRLTAETLAARG